MNQLQNKLNMLRRWVNIALGKSATAIRQDQGKYFSTTELSGYYNDLTGKVGDGTVIDNKGIPMSRIGKEEFAYFPIAIFQYGLGMYDLHFAGDPHSDCTVLKTICGSFLVKNVTYRPLSGLLIVCSFLSKTAEPVLGTAKNYFWKNILRIPAEA